jgi:hypothetical protein
MKLEAIMKIEDAVAHFTVSHRGPGLYHAHLIRFNGNPDLAPPSRIILVRSVRQWTGSSDNQALLNNLGDVIDRAVSEAPIFKNEKNRKPPDQRKSPEQEDENR